MTATAAEQQQQLVGGRYRLERVLGRGGMGTVHLARDLKLEHRVALKLAHAGGAAEELFRARFAREARIGGHLGRTPGFVRALDWGEAGDGHHLFLVMDFIDGRPLDLSAARPLEARLSALARAARVVAQAHALGVVHRDLKPGNLLETPDGQVFLADFGLAKVPGHPPDADGAADRAAEALTAAGLPLGTPAYMPPEQFDDAATVDARADVYALGVMLFQALAGRLPFEGRVVDAQRAQAGVAPRPRDVNPDVPKALDVLCSQALALDPDLRVPTALALVDGLAAAAAAAGLTVPGLAPGEAPAPDGATAATGRVEVEVQHASRLCFAMEHCGVPLVEVVRVTNRTWAPIEHATLRLELGPDLGKAAVFDLPTLYPGDAQELDALEFRPAADRLRQLEERERARLRWSVVAGAHVYHEGEGQVDVLAMNEWPGEQAPPQLLAVFVTPNHPVVGRVLARVRDRLAAAGGDPALTGYQDRSKPRVRAVVCALYETLQALGITYAPAPASFERQGQKVRLADVVLRERLGNCLDLTLLFAACLEQMGLNPLVVVVEGHALPGVWLQDDPVGLLGGLAEDAARLRTLRALNHVLLLDVTVAAQWPAGTFDAAEEAAGRALEDDARFRFALDVRPLRDPRYGFRPLPLRALAQVQDEHAAPDPVSGTGDDVRRILEEAAREAEQQAKAPQPAAAPPEPKTPTPHRFRRWQDRLLDLTLRNRLLAFTLKGRGALPLEVPDLAGFEDRLASGEAFHLVPRPAPLEGAAAARPDPAAVREGRLADLARNRLHTSLLDEELLARGRHLTSEARTGLEEGGATTLFVAVGLLRWFDEEGEERLAPLVLYPAALELDRKRRVLRVRRIADEDPLGNVTLREKVRRDQAVDLSVLDALPHDEAGLDVKAILTQVREAIRHIPRWEVLEDAHVGLFTFTRFLMWRDLKDHQETLLQSSAVSRIATSRSPTDSEVSLIEVAPEQLDGSIEPAQLPLVVDADATQTSAVVSALRGRSFVLQGPPGTGKSQTITNLIAAALAAGKTVLFVSEKMAALDVVHRRLEAVGLGDFCLELHSHKASKKDVLASLRRSLERADRQAAVPWEERSRELRRLRDDLNAYVRELHAAAPCGLSFFQARSRLMELSGAPALRVERAPDAPGHRLARRALQVTSPELSAMHEAVAVLAERGRVSGPPAEHPFRESELDDWSEAVQRAVREACEDVTAAVERVERAAAPLLEAAGAAAGVIVPTAGLAALAALATEVAKRPAPTPLLLEDVVARAITTEAGHHADALDEQAARRAALAARWKDGLLELDVAALAAKFDAWHASNALFRWFALGGGRKALRPHARGAGAPPGRAAGELPADDVVAKDLALAAVIVKEQPALDAASASVAERLEGVWDPESGSAGLRALLEHARAVRAARGQVLATAPGLDPQPLLRRCAPATFRATRDDLRAWAGDLAEAVGGLDAAEAALRDAGKVKGWPRRGAGDHRGRLRDTAERWVKELRRLREWCFYRAAVTRARGLDLGFLVDAHAQGKLGPEEAGAAFERWFLERLLEALRDAREPLRRFDGAQHHRRVEEFGERDRTHLELARSYVAAQLEARLPTPAAVVAESSELGRLRRELKKQRGHLAVRALLRELPELLPRLKPCLLMSPLSVAQYLPADGRRFDVVVFDEASQIATHEAIGAMARGVQVVVVGDSRQLPPTTFFQRVLDDAAEEGAEDEGELEELESVLDEALASQLPEQTLGWHYRSRHEALIEFSNRHYYEDRLTIFPAARAAADVGVRWHPVEGGAWSGSSGPEPRTNRAEAEALVAHLVGALSAYAPGERSFGVVTFNKPQQELIEGLLDEARAARPELEAHFATDEPPFVKNLENVQGDERDEVLFSVTYARDAAGRLRMHFGPLSVAGGERRLNVAITRARRQLHVFATLTADQIDLSRTRSRGTEHLRLFLEFAARHGREAAALEGAPGDGIKAALERDVHAALVGFGLQVRPWVGCGHYRIDLGVVSPDHPDEYLLGVECDGPAYAAGATARDRDRLRRQVLEGLGWRMHRVWLLDWCEDRDREVARLRKAVEAAREDAYRRREREQRAGEKREAVAARVAATGAGAGATNGGGAPAEGEPAEAESVGAMVTGALAPPRPARRPAPPAPTPPKPVQRPAARSGAAAGAPRAPAPPGPPAPMQPYEQASPRQISSDQDDLFRPAALRPLFDRIEEVVNAEAPLHLDLLVRRVLDSWCFSRVLPRARARVLDEGLDAVQRAGKLDVRGEFVWRPGQRLTVFRTGGERKAEHVPPDEVAVAARWILEQNVALEHDDLARETARQLGFTRLGPQISEAMRAGIKHLAEQRRCVVEGTRVRLA